MKAIVIHHYGPPEVLKYESVPAPEPRAGEIRIRIHAATVNRVLDVSLRAGNERARGPVLPLIPGVDCAGVVDALGAGVTRWQPGMRVAAAGVMPLDICPEDHKDYAGPTGMMGIKRPGRFAEVVAVTGGKGADGLYDNIANPTVLPKALRAIGFDGRLVTAGAHAGPHVAIDFAPLYHKRITIKGQPGYPPADVPKCFAAAAAGRIKAQIERVLPLSRAAEAHRLVESGESLGKIVLDPTRG